MASAFDPAKSLLAWRGFADGARINQPGAVAPHHAENKYKTFAAKAIGEMAYGGFEHWLDNRANKRAKEEKVIADRDKIRYDNQINSETPDDGFGDNTGTLRAKLDKERNEQNELNLLNNPNTRSRTADEIYFGNNNFIDNINNTNPDLVESVDNFATSDAVKEQKLKDKELNTRLELFKPDLKKDSKLEIASKGAGVNRTISSLLLKQQQQMTDFPSFKNFEPNMRPKRHAHEQVQDSFDKWINGELLGMGSKDNSMFYDENGNPDEVLIKEFGNDPYKFYSQRVLKEENYVPYVEGEEEEASGFFETIFGLEGTTNTKAEEAMEKAVRTKIESYSQKDLTERVKVLERKGKGMSSEEKLEMELIKNKIFRRF